MNADSLVLQLGSVWRRKSLAPSERWFIDRVLEWPQSRFMVTMHSMEQPSCIVTVDAATLANCWKQVEDNPGGIKYTVTLKVAQNALRGTA